MPFSVVMTVTTVLPPPMRLFFGCFLMGRSERCFTDHSKMQQTLRANNKKLSLPLLN